MLGAICTEKNKVLAIFYRFEGGSQTSGAVMARLLRFHYSKLFKYQVFQISYRNIKNITQKLGYDI